MEERNIKVSLERAKEWYEGNNTSLRELALQAFSKEELEKVELPETWEEWLIFNNNKSKSEYYIDDNSFIRDYTGIRNTSESNLLETKEEANAILALIKLIRLRDTYRQGWKPDWNDSSVKYSIVFYFNKSDNNIFTHAEQILSFQSKEIRDKFLENFKDLIEEIKPLF